MAVRQATEEEKRKIADNIQVEIENAPESMSPLAQVLSQLDTYDANMRKQIENVKVMIDVNDKIMKAVSALYDACENEEKKKIYKDELGARQDVLVNLNKSIILMQKRVQLTPVIKELATNNLDILKQIDLYFGNQLGVFSEQDMNDLLEQGIK